MNHAMLLDCTLRDGAYLIDKKFGDNNINGIIDGLVKARIDCIEIGFFQNDGYGEGKTVFKNSADAKRFVPNNKNNSMFTVLADCSRYSVSNLDECDGSSIDAVRECFFKHELNEAIQNCKIIKQKGYKCFVQPVDILGYSDIELIELINQVNEVEPYCLSIVDTFGSMYAEDLHRVFEIINHNLISTCKIGFHSHNNMQMSNALSQEFIRMTYGKRSVVVDGTISGMGRGAGNTPTELIAQYMVSQLGYNYDMDILLDIIDDYMDNIKSKCSWGYTTPYFVAGCYSAHVNNISYLMQKSSIRSKNIRYILNKIGAVARKRYDYDLLETTYLEYLASDINDEPNLQKLYSELKEKEILVVAPGASVIEQKDVIKKYINDNNPIVITINFVHDLIKSDYVYMSNSRRYSYCKNNDMYLDKKKIITSNLKTQSDDDLEYIISFNKLVKCGWEHIDNSTLMLLRLLDMMNVKSIAIAGLDGYSFKDENSVNYMTPELELYNVTQNPAALNKEISNMLKDYKETRKSESEIKIITQSRFSNVFE